MPGIHEVERNEVLSGITASLSSTSGVQEAAFFGSMATGRADRLSDIDLVVQCDRESASRFAQRLHEVIGVVLYRPFTEDRWPAGRYWFRDVNPFLRLDVSFYRGAGFQELLLRGAGPKQPPFTSLALGMNRVFAEASRALPSWSDVDFDFAGALRRFHDSAKAVERGFEPRLPVHEAERGVLWFESSELRPGVWELYERSLRHLRGSA